MIATTPNKYSGSLLKIFQEQVDAFGGSNIANVVLHENICHTQVPVDDFLTICTPEQKNYQGGGGLCNLVASPRLSSTRFCMHIMMDSGGCCFDINQFDKQLDHNINEGVIHTLFTGSYHAQGNDGYSVFGTITDKKNAGINDTPTFV